MIWCWKNAVNIMEGIGISKEFLKIAQRVEPLIGFGDKLTYLIFSCFLPCKKNRKKSGNNMIVYCENVKIKRWFFKKVFEAISLF